MRILTSSLLLLFFLVSCKENNTEDQIRETWRLTVTETIPLRIAFTQQNRILNEIYGNISEYNKKNNKSKLDSVKILRSKIIKESERNLIQLRKQSNTNENSKMLTATINLLVSLLEVENALPSVYDKVEKNIDNKFTPSNESFLEIVKRYQKNGGNYDAVKNEYYKKNKETIETSL